MFGRSAWLILGAGYLLVLLSSGAWRMIIRSLAYHPWSQLVHGFVEAFPTSRWRGPSKLIGLALAWCFAGMVLMAFTVFVVGVEILFSPRDVYWSVRRRRR